MGDLLLPVYGTNISEGYIRVQSQEFRIRIRFPSEEDKKRMGKGIELPNSPGSFLSCDKQLFDLLQGYGGIVQQRLLLSPNLESFVVELKDIIDRLLRNRTRETLPPLAYYRRLFVEMSGIGMDNLVSIDEDMTKISLQIVDGDGRIHPIKVSFPGDYPRQAPLCTTDLPKELDLVWLPGFSINNVLVQYRELIDSLQETWRVLEDIDQHTFVLEPENRPGCFVSRAITTRRIAISRGCSIQIDVDISQPREICECRFFGSETIIRPLRLKLSQGLGLWDPQNKLPRQNLEAILGLEFPVMTKTNEVEFNSECGICYSFKLQDAIPDRTCDNEQCQRPFHRSCLFHWLKSLPSARQSFHTVFGVCPYCSHPITVQAPT